ncbi:hypothetical protein D1007_47612 [Hordeum vulgare]|nr:hypothetical protein D1007_47612 [Hordeum vulgare]
MHRHVALLVAHELRRRHAARRRCVGGLRRAIGRDVVSENKARLRGNHARQPASPGATTGEPRGCVPNTLSGPPPLGTRRELLEARDLAVLGRLHPTSPGMLHGTRREYRRPDYINSKRRAQFDDTMRANDPVMEEAARTITAAVGARATLLAAHANRYKQHHGGGFTGIPSANVLAGHTCCP